MGKNIAKEKVEVEVEEELTVDDEKLEKFLSYVSQLCNTYNRKVDEIFDKTEIELKKELQYIIDKYVDAFYSAYTPGSHPYGNSKVDEDTGLSSAPYHRLFNLYDAFRIEVEDDDWRVEAGHEFMDPMRGSKGADITKQVFELSLRWGFHGGAFNHGTPYWRTPPEWKSWYMPAVQTEPVLYQLMDEAEQAIEKYRKKATDECEEFKQKIKTRIFMRAGMINFYTKDTKKEE